MTEPGDSGTGARGEDRPWWRDVPTAVAVVGLIVALSFNTIGVWRSVQESEQTRRATEVNLLTQLDAFVNQAEQELNATEDLDTRCNGNRVYSLSDGDNARLFAALQYYDYMAWLFNEEHITMGPAKSYWAPNMLDTYRVGTIFRPQKEINEHYAELAAFQRTADEALWPRDPCPGGAGAGPRGSG